MNNYIISHRNKSPDRYYVYLHIRKSDGRVFYVGKGCGSRAWHTKNRSNYWNNIAVNSEYDVKIVAHKLPENESLLLEKKLIEEFRDSICNLTSGGESPVFTEETLQKMSKARLGKKFTEDHKRKLGDSRRGKSRDYFNGSLNPNYDSNTYLFQRVSDLQEFNGTREQFCEKYNLSVKSLKGLFLTKPNKTSQGWKLKEQT